MTCPAELHPGGLHVSAEYLMEFGVMDVFWSFRPNVWGEADHYASLDLEGNWFARRLALCAALAFGGSASAATLVADYEFNGNFSSSVAGAPDLVATDPLGTSSFTGGVYNLTGVTCRRPTRAV